MDNSQRRRRRIARNPREQTPDHTQRNTPDQRSDMDNNQVDRNGDPTLDNNVTQVSMQIRAPGTRSAHESKILRRRDKINIASNARSLSQPRKAEHLTSPEVDILLRSGKRSLSTPRHKEESSDVELSSAQASDHNHLVHKEAPGDINRLERNLRRFEEERKRFEAEKRLFEREKREHKLRHKNMYGNNEERKRLIQNYRKLSDRIQLPSDPDERLRYTESLRSDIGAALPVQTRNVGYEESSTQFSSSEADTAEEVIGKRIPKHFSAVRRHASAATEHIVSVRGPPPEPPAAPEKRAVSRNNSLSPIRPKRRSITPEQRIEKMKKLGMLTSDNESSASIPTQPAMTDNIQHNDYILNETQFRSSKSPENVLKHRQKNIDVGHLPVESIPSPRRDSKANAQSDIAKKTIFEKLKSLFSRKETTATNSLNAIETKKSPSVPSVKLEFWPFLREFYAEACSQWVLIKSDYPKQVRELKIIRNKCFAHIIMLIMLCGFGALMFRYTEGASENIYKCEVRKVKRDFIDNLWTVSHSMREDDWKSMARQKLRKFEEELQELQELGIRRKSGMKSWNFVNCILYCWTVISTIGYGHITPQTVLGRSLTIIYAIIGIPMFLILLADFGKLFTRMLKFLWAYVRRLYYTGTCRKIRKQQQVRDAMSGFNTMYEAAIRRPSQFFSMTGDGDIESQVSDPIKSGVNISHPETPTSPYPETFEIDDEFNLPVSVASILLISYIIFGAFVYTLWEDWTYFEAFYFVFISMSTIGFGDFVPNHPIFMMCSIIYLVFGLALTSMFINVVQIKLSDTFKQASAKLGATIGFGVASETGDDAGSHLKTPSDLASIHGSRLGKILEDNNEQSYTATPNLTSILRPARPVSPITIDDIVSTEPPPLLPRRQVSMEPSQEKEEKKKKRFFK